MQRNFNLLKVIKTEESEEWVKLEDQHKKRQLKFLISSNRKGRLVSTGGPVFIDTPKVCNDTHFGKKSFTPPAQ
ncbi:MAG: hypothetical protein ABI416_03935 [Ginsengibacter sp.]